MSIFSAISQGMQDQKEFRHGQRQQMAEAFADYKAANPYATAADFQSFVDSYSGGNNYISGGAPSVNVRNRIAAENFRQKEIADRTRLLGEMEDMRRISDLFSTDIDNALLNAPIGKDGTVEFNKAYETFMENNPRFDKLGFDIKGQFNQTRFDKLRRGRIAENYENAMKFIEDAKDPTNINVGMFADMYGLGEGIAKEVLDQAKVEFNETQQKKKDNFNTTVNARVRELAKDSTITPANLLATLESEFGGNPLWDKTDTDFIGGVVKEGEDLLAKAKDARFKALLTEAQGEASRLEGIYSQRNMDVLQIEKDLRSKYNYLLQSEDNDFFDKLFADRDWLDQIVDRATSTQSVATETRRDEAQRSAYQAVEAAIIRGDDPSTLLATARSTLPKEFEDILGTGSAGIPDDLATMITNATEKYELKVDAERSDELSKVETKLWNQTVATAIESQLRVGGMEAASKYISETLSSTLTGEYWLSKEGIAEKEKFIQEHLEGVIKLNQDVMDGQITDGILTAKDREKQLLATAVSDNAEKASQIFAGDASKIKSGGNPYLQEIAPQLAKDWLMNDNTKNLLLTFATSDSLKNAGENVTPSQLKNMADAWLRAHGATPWADAVESLSTDELVQQRTLFTDYQDSVEAHISETIDSFESSFNEIQQNSKEFETAEQYDSAIRVLNNLKGQYRKWVGEYGNVLENNFETRRNWRDIAGKAYDRDAIDELYAGASGYLSDNTAVDRLIDRLKTQKERIQPTDLNNENRNQDWYNQYYDDTKSVDWNNKNKKRIEAKFDLNLGQLRSEKALGTDLPFVGNKLEEWLKGRVGDGGVSLRNLLLGSEDAENRDQIAQRKFLDEMTDDIGVKAYFRRNPEVFQAFIEDPFKAIEEVPELASMAVSFGYEIPK
jgi:hypothetical protein